jgi:biopolymer transport protein ExbB
MTNIYFAALSIPAIIEKFGNVIYAALAVLATWGVYNSIMLYRSIAKKSIPAAQVEGLVHQVRELVKVGNYNAAIEACRTPAYWHTAFAQLIAVALKNRDKGIAKIKQLLVMEFHSEVISGLESRLASISTIVRMGPLLGLLGTVASMIGAFGRIGGGDKVNPNELAMDISLALWATGSGLLIATPMMILGNDIHAKLRKLRDRTERQLGDFIEILEQAGIPSGPSKYPIESTSTIPAPVAPGTATQAAVQAAAQQAAIAAAGRGAGTQRAGASR